MLSYRYNAPPLEKPTTKTKAKPKAKSPPPAPQLLINQVIRPPSAASVAGLGAVEIIIMMMARPTGATKAEITAVLTKAFPDRDPVAMTSTLHTTMSKNRTGRVKDGERGNVYLRQIASCQSE
jgi:hypothetical protein